MERERHPWDKFPPDKYFTVVEVARYLNISVGKAYRVLDLPGFPKEEENRRYYVNKELFFEWYENYEGII